MRSHVLTFFLWNNLFSLTGDRYPTRDEDVDVTTTLVGRRVEHFTDSEPTHVTDSDILRLAGDEAVGQRHAARQISITLTTAQSSQCKC